MILIGSSLRILLCSANRYSVHESRKKLNNFTSTTSEEYFTMHGSSSVVNVITMTCKKQRPARNAFLQQMFRCMALRNDIEYSTNRSMYCASMYSIYIYGGGGRWMRLWRRQARNVYSILYILAQYTGRLVLYSISFLRAIQRNICLQVCIPSWPLTLTSHSYHIHEWTRSMHSKVFFTCRRRGRIV